MKAKGRRKKSRDQGSAVRYQFSEFSALREFPVQVKVGKFNSCRTVEDQIQPENGVRGLRRLRYLIDIVALVAVTFLLDAALSAFIPAPIDWRKGFVFDAMGKMLLVGVGWGLIRL